MKYNSILIIANGMITNELKTLDVDNFDYIICADGGIKHALDNGVTPHLLLGDMDSSANDIVMMAREKNITIEKHPVEKDATDLELALIKAKSFNPKTIVILGGWGSRWDHSFVNLQMMALYTDKFTHITMINENNTACAVLPGKEINLRGEKNDIVSFMPLTAQVFGVTLTGFYYPLHNAVLNWGTSYSASNQLTGKEGTITIKEGLLIAFQYHQE